METRVCKQCGVEKSLDDFEKEEKRGQVYYRWKCKECGRSKRYSYIKKYRDKNPEKQKEIFRNWSVKNREKIYAERKAKRESDEVYRCIELLRNRIWKAFDKKGNIKSESLEKILGCTIKEFYQHLLDTFLENYGENYNKTQEVNIDHIIPLATAKTKEDVYKLFHYSNLQLLTAEDNGKKWCKLSWEIERQN